MADSSPEKIEPYRIELEHDEAFSSFMLRSRAEITFILRSLVEHARLLHLQGAEGTVSYLTSILGYDSDAGVLFIDPSNDESINRRLIADGPLFLATSLDRIKVQFRLTHAAASAFAGRPALRAPFPEGILRLQRREYFRLATPVANPLRCIVSGTSPDGLPVRHELPLIDISGGGVSLMVASELAPDFAAGSRYDNCLIQIPEEGALAVRLQVRNLFDVQTKSGAEYKRAGCEFIDLRGSQLSTLQRYITRIERERKARLSGW
jgi:flagellar brake protein